eukprot:gene9661-1868_t
MSDQKYVILPGNGCTNVKEANWYYSLQKELIKLNLNAVLENMPDPFVAREKNWIPFIEKELKADENTILIGHSSGAVASMRYAENHKIKGMILVSACWTDLGEANEKASGYYSRKWEWDKIKKNCDFIVQLHSKNDPFIPMDESDFINKNLNSKYFVYDDLGHFMFEKFPELLEIIKNIIK